MFGFKMRFFNYQKSLLVQTICRSRIRQHQGLPVKVWFSSDIDYQMAWEVQEYFKANSSPDCKISGIIKPFRKLSKPDKKYLFFLTRLYSYDPLIRSAIESGSAYGFSIDLDGLDRFVHLKYKKRNHYRYLQKALKKYGITMTIL